MNAEPTWADTLEQMRQIALANQPRKPRRCIVANSYRDLFLAQFPHAKDPPLVDGVIVPQTLYGVPVYFVDDPTTMNPTDDDVVFP